MEEKTSLLILVPQGISTVIEVYIPVCKFMQHYLYDYISIQPFYCHLLAAKKKANSTRHCNTMTTPTNL